jgi:hypothetical protein
MQYHPLHWIILEQYMGTKWLIAKVLLLLWLGKYPVMHRCYAGQRYPLAQVQESGMKPGPMLLKTGIIQTETLEAL